MIIDQLRSLQEEIDNRFPLDEEGYVIEAIREVLDDRYTSVESAKLALIAWILDRSQELLNED